MEVRAIRTPTDALAAVDARKLSHVTIGVTDLDGVLRGKLLARDKLESAFKSGIGFCDVILGWDMADQVSDILTS